MKCVLSTDGKVARVFVEVAGSDEEVEESLEGPDRVARVYPPRARRQTSACGMLLNFCSYSTTATSTAAGWKNC